MQTLDCLLQYSGTPVIQIPLGPGVVYKPEKSISLKLCINNLTRNLLEIAISSTTLIEQSLL